MSKEAIFTLKLESELREAFVAEAKAVHRPASQVVRELMRAFVQRQRDAREGDDFPRRKVTPARAQKDAGLHAPDANVEAEAAAGRAALREADQAEA